MRSRRAWLVAMVLAAAPVFSQEPPLRIVSVTPQGEVAQREDATEIRIVFSEPMVAVGVRSTTAPSWLALTPAIRAQYFWSGTRTLVVSRANAPLPFATRYTLKVDTTARSTRGRALAAPEEFTFSTPTVKLLESSWARKTGKVDSPVVFRLQFNQPVGPADVLRHLTAQFVPHDWVAPTYPVSGREFLEREDPAGLNRFDAKVSRARTIARRSDTVPLRLAKNKKGEEDNPAIVTIETRSPPPPNAQIGLVLAATMPSPAGPLRGVEQRRQHLLEPALFARPSPCAGDCLVGFASVGLTRPPARGQGTLVRITDVTAGQPASAPKSVGGLTYNSREGTITFPNFPVQMPRTRWLIQIDATLRAEDGQELGYPWAQVIDRGAAPPFFTLQSGTWEAANGTALPLHARNVESTTTWFEQVRLADIARSLDSKDFEVPSSAVSRPIDLSIRPDVDETHPLDVGEMLKGRTTALFRMFWREPSSASAGPSMRRSLIQMTNLGVTVRKLALSTLVLVTRIDTAQPVGGARVSILAGDASTLWSGTTNSDGYVVAPLTAKALESATIAAAESGDDAAWVRLHEARYGSVPVDELRAAVFTDRGIYTAGDDVRIKALIRDESGADLRLLPEGTKVIAVIWKRDHEHQIDRRELTVNRWSSVEWSVPVGSDMEHGRYEIALARNVAEADELWHSLGSRGSFEVGAFRRPDFAVSVKLAADRALPIQGTPLTATIEARYLFGAAVGAQPSKWQLRSEPVSELPSGIAQRFGDQYAFSYWPDDRGDSNRGQRQLDHAGRTVVALSALPQTDYAARITFEAEVLSRARQAISARSALVLHPASVYVGVRESSFVVPVGRPLTTDVIAVDLAGALRSGVPLVVSLVREEWPEGSTARWNPRRRKEVVAGTWRRRSAATPLALKLPVVNPGSYILRVIGRDEQNRPTRTETRFFAIGDGWTSRHGSGPLDLATERSTWKAGETARVLLRSTWPRATAFVTTERAGVRTVERVAITSGQHVVDVPIREEDIPIVRVGVTLIKGRTPEPEGQLGDPGRPASITRSIDLTVDPAPKRLAVTITTDRAEYQPGARARVSATIRGADGKPRQGELTFWAIDRGVAMLTTDALPDPATIFYERYLWMGGDVDNRQALIPRPVFVRPHHDPMAVRLKDSLVVRGATELFHTQTATVSATPGWESVRSDFRALAFWVGSAAVGVDGRAVADVTLPDSLTAYRIIAVASTTASEFGSAEAVFRTTKGVALLQSFPRFLTSGDAASFGALATNNSGRAGRATVTIASLNPDVLTFAETSTTVDLAAGESRDVRFAASARNAGSARVRVAIVLGDDTDAFELPLTVQRTEVTWTSATSGDTRSRVTERYDLPTGSRVTDFSVSLASTALVGLGPSVQYLRAYPYECAEQRASRALGTLLSLDLHGTFAPASADSATIRTDALALLSDLHRYQCPDGSFSLFAGSCTLASTYLTAYVLDALRESRPFGASLRTAQIDRALDVLEREWTMSHAEDYRSVAAASRAYALKVLSEYGRDTRDGVRKLYADADRLPVFALSYLADAIAARADRGQMYDDLLRRIRNAVRVNADRAFVDEREDPGLEWVWSTSVKSTAIVLEGMARRNDRNDLAPAMVRWLLSMRTNGRWNSTQDNISVLRALLGYLRTAESERPDMIATVTIAGALAGQAQFSGYSTTPQTIRPPLESLTSRTGDLEIARNGAGMLHYTTRVQYATPESTTSDFQGLQIERQYTSASGRGGPATSFKAGDLVRVTLSVTLPHDGQYLAMTDRLPAGFEAVDASLETTARLNFESRNFAAEASAAWRRGYFDHVEHRDDRVLAFATHLGPGRHEFSYLARATTAGTFTAGGATIEAMYAPELIGRTGKTAVTIK